MIDRAIAFAVKAHEGQPRKGTDIPYIFHPIEVGMIVSRITDDAEVIAAAVLHDTVEDCASVTLDVIRQVRTLREQQGNLPFAFRFPDA